MPKETRLIGPTQLRVIPEGGRELVVHVSPNEIAVIPMDAAGRLEIARGLAMEDDDMRREAGRQHAASRIVVPNGPVNGSRPA